MPKVLTVLAVLAVLTIVAAAVVVTYVCSRGTKKVRGQRLIFAMAKRRAAETGKPLVVIGDPAPPKTLNALFGAGYGGGDYCIDINGCPSCVEESTVRVKARIQDVLPGLRDNSAVIFESEVLPYISVDEIDGVIAHLWRASGGDLFCSHSNAIDLSRYARTGALQKPSPFHVLRSSKLGAMGRVYYAFPPFHDFKAVEFTNKKFDREKSETWHLSKNWLGR